MHSRLRAPRVFDPDPRAGTASPRIPRGRVPSPRSRARGVFVAMSTSAAAPTASPEEQAMVVDGVAPDAHRRFFDEMPWYAVPVANLCSDVNVEAWSGITVVFLLLKFFAVSALTNATVAALIVTVATLTALVWFHVFVLVGSRSHRALYDQVPFSKFLQTFWVGAIVCPVGVYMVRAAVGAAIALVPGVSTIASPSDVVSGGVDEESEDADPGASRLGAVGGGTSLAVAFVVAYVAAGFAEEAAKYFGIARYYPPDQLERDAADGGSRASSRPRQSGCANPAAGWLTPRRDPRAVVYLAFVVGLGFSFTENIQYGANVYAVATAWGDAGNMTMRQNVTIDALMDPFTDYNDGAAASAELAIRARARTWDAELEAPSLAALASHVTSRTAAGRVGRRFDPVLVAREAGPFPRAPLSLPATRDVAGAGAGSSDDHTAIVNGRRVHIYQTEAAIEEAARNEQIAVEGPESVEVNVTVQRRPYSESAKRAAAMSVTLLRGLTPMHAAWAGLTSTRFVRQLWLPTGDVGSGLVDVLRCISWSWFYHGTFDFAIMAAPALIAAGADGRIVIGLLTVGFATAAWSWVHLTRATYGLETDLTRAGLEATGEGLPRLGLCTGDERRKCCCVCMPCVGCLCPGVGEWDRAESVKGYGAA